MSKEKSKDLTYFKDLGTLQEKILFHLAENPNKHSQEIQKGLEYPASQYGNINKTVKTLEKLGYVKSNEGKSQKNVRIKLYSCAENGIFYTLAKNPKANIERIVEKYKKDYPLFTPFPILSSLWGKERVSRFFENSFEFILMKQKEGAEKALSFLLMKVYIEAQDSDPQERKKIVKEILKHFPKTRQTMKEMKKTINEILEE